MARDEVQAQLHHQLEAHRRGQILDAAARVFGARGFRAARVQDVAREANLANGTVYNYFPNKDALLIGLLDRLNETERRPEMLAGLDTADMAPEAAFAAVLRHRLAVMAANEDLLRALLPELLVDPALRARYLDEVVMPSLALAEAALARRVGPARAARVARVVAASVFGVVVLRLLEVPGTRGDDDGIAALLAELLGPAFADGGAR